MFKEGSPSAKLNHSMFVFKVELARKFVFRHAKKTFPEDAIPIIAANMDTVGTFEMAVVLAKVFDYLIGHRSGERGSMGYWFCGCF